MNDEIAKWAANKGTTFRLASVIHAISSQEGEVEYIWEDPIYLYNTDIMLTHLCKVMPVGLEIDYAGFYRDVRDTWPGGCYRVGSRTISNVIADLEKRQSGSSELPMSQNADSFYYNPAIESPYVSKGNPDAES